MAGRKGSGAWVERAAELAARLAALSTGSRDAIKQVADEAGLSVVVARRYLDAYDHVRAAAGDVTISLSAVEHLKTWAKLDPLAAAAAREDAFAGRVPLSEIQRAITNARVRAAVPRPAGPPEAVEAIVEKFAAVVDLPEPGLVFVPARAETWIGLSADATEMAFDDEAGTTYVWYRWALVLSPNVVGSPLSGLPFEGFLLRLAAAASIYDHVSAYCCSAFEREEVARVNRLWWPRRQDQLSIL